MILTYNTLPFHAVQCRCNICHLRDLASRKHICEKLQYPLIEKGIPIFLNFLHVLSKEKKNIKSFQMKIFSLYNLEKSVYNMDLFSLYSAD